jgi:cAMP-dependent protein kinase regulator
MGCGGSKEQTVDFSNVDAAAKKKKDGANKSASPSDKKNARPTGRIGQSSTFNLLPDLVPFTSNTRISELPIISPDAALQRFLSAPTMTDAVRTTTASTNKAVKTGAHHLKNIFAKPLDDTDISSFKAAVFAKDGKEKEFIREAVKNNFVFAALSERELRTLVDAFEKIQVKQDEVIIKQGDPGDYFYVIRDGKVKFNIAGQTVGETSEGSFGELALLYTCPRAATVIAETKTVLYRVDQKTFRYILQSQTLQTDNDTRELLKKVPFLAELDPTDLNKLVYAMSPLSFEAGEYLLRKGEIGDVLYVIQEGDVKVTNITVGSTDYEDQELGPGSYFGERAWVKLEPRPANCIAKTKVVALTIDKETFEKVVGDVSMLTLKSEDKRKLVSVGSDSDSDSYFAMKLA